MSAYDKLAVCLFNFKCKAPERGGASEFEGEQNMIENGAREREREGKRRWRIAGREGRRRGCAPQMLDVSVWGTDKATHKFESRMTTSWDWGGEVLAVGQEGKEVEAVGGGAGSC